MDEVVKGKKGFKRWMESQKYWVWIADQCPHLNFFETRKRRVWQDEATLWDGFLYYQALQAYRLQVKEERKWLCRYRRAERDYQYYLYWLNLTISILNAEHARFLRWLAEDTLAAAKKLAAKKRLAEQALALYCFWLHWVYLRQTQALQSSAQIFLFLHCEPAGTYAEIKSIEMFEGSGIISQFEQPRINACLSLRP